MTTQPPGVGLGYAELLRLAAHRAHEHAQVELEEAYERAEQRRDAERRRQHNRTNGLSIWGHVDPWEERAARQPHREPSYSPGNDVDTWELRWSHQIAESMGQQHPRYIRIDDGSRWNE